MWGKRKSTLLAFLIVVCASSAQATCVTYSALQNGIELLRSDPLVRELARVTETGELVMRTIEDARLNDDRGSDPWQWSLDVQVHSSFVHPLAIAEIEFFSGNIQEIRYSDDPSVLDQLDELGTWRTTGTSFRDGRLPFEISYAWYHWGNAQLEIAGCNYSVWIVGHVTQWDYQSFVSELWYAPEAGMVIATRHPHSLLVTAFDYVSLR